MENTRIEFAKATTAPPRFTILEENKAFDPAEALQNHRIDTTAELAENPVLLKIGNSIIATLANFMLLIGKAKSRKTFLLTALIAAAASGRCLIDFITGFVMTSNICLHFDPEQSQYHAQRTAKRICKQIGIEQPVNYQAFGLRDLDPRQRLEAIDYAIRNTPGLALVVIDGIADLLSRGINDEEEAIKLTTYLLQWTQQYNIHIIVIIHVNKADGNARGHIGTSLMNKAETVLSVTKDPKNRDISIVHAEYCRDKDFEDFAFTINDEGLPILAEATEGSQSRKTAAMNENFIQLLPGMRSMNYTDLCQEYMEISGLGLPSAKKHISIATKSGIIRKDNAGLYRAINTQIEYEPTPF